MAKSIRVVCTDNSGFEDALTMGGSYKVKALRGGSVQIENDKETVRWYGMSKFGVLPL